MFDLIFLIILLCITYFTGSIIEKNHFKKIKQREIRLIKKPIITYGTKRFQTNRPVKKVELVTGEVVISGDYFKNFVASLKNLFGGKLTPFESILDRARREALLKMREKAANASIIVNARIETVLLNNIYIPNSVPQCAIIAYGTAITYDNQKKL